MGYVMNNHWLLAVSLGLLVHSPAFAIDSKYAAQLERSGCTQLSELQGCDITRTAQENAKAGFGAAAAVPPGSQGAPAGQSPVAGNWKAVDAGGGAVAEIHIDDMETVWVDGNEVQTSRNGGALVFSQGGRTYTFQSDRSLQGKDTWADGDAGERGAILPE